MKHFGILLPPGVLTLAEQDTLSEHFKQKMGFIPKKEQRAYSPLERAEIAGLYDRCRDHGYFPADVDKFGRLRFRRAVKSNVCKMLEKGLENHLLTV